MHYALVEVAAPASEPLELEAVKRYLRVDGTDENELITDLIREARQRCERVTDRLLVTATWRLTLDEFPCWDLILPYRVVSVASIVYDDADGTATTLSAALYRVDSDSTPGRITPAYGTVWPVARCQTGAVRITYTAGETATVTEEIKGRLRACVAYCYDHREHRDEAWLDSLFGSFWTGSY